MRVVVDIVSLIIILITIYIILTANLSRESNLALVWIVSFYVIVCWGLITNDN